MPWDGEFCALWIFLNAYCIFRVLFFLIHTEWTFQIQKPFKIFYGLDISNKLWLSASHLYWMLFVDYSVIKLFGVSFNSSTKQTSLCHEKYNLKKFLFYVEIELTVLC